MCPLYVNKADIFCGTLKLGKPKMPMKKVKEQSGTHDYKDAIELMFFRIEISYQTRMPFYKNTVSGGPITACCILSDAIRDEHSPIC